MSEVMEIAKKTPATGAQKGMDPMDRVVLFLNQEKKLIQLMSHVQAATTNPISN